MMFDSKLAVLYQVETKVESGTRNPSLDMIKRLVRHGDASEIRIYAKFTEKVEL